MSIENNEIVQTSLRIGNYLKGNFLYDSTQRKHERSELTCAQRVFKNFLSLAAAGIIGRLLAMAVIFYLARRLTSAGFGMIGFAVSFIVFFEILSNLGVTTLGTREVARDKEKLNDYVNNIISLRLGLGILSFFLLVGCAVFIPKPLEVKYLLIFYGLTIFPAVFLLEWAFQGIERMKYIAISRILGSIAYLILIVLFINEPGKFLLIPWLLLAANFISAAFLAVIFIKYAGRITLNFHINTWGKYLKRALPMGFTGIMMMVLWYSDTIMLGFMRSYAEVGYYYAACKIIAFIFAFAGFFQVAIFPILSRYYKESLEKTGRILSQSFKLAISVALPIACAGTILAERIMALFGNEFSKGVIALQILFWTLFLMYINSVYARGLIACDRQKRNALVVAVITIVNIILNLILIPRFGISGAAVATLAAEVLAVLLYYKELGRIVKTKLYGHILKPLFASIIMVVFLKLCASWNIFVIICGGASTYLAAFYLMKGISRAELRLMKGIIGK